MLLSRGLSATFHLQRRLILVGATHKGIPSGNALTTRFINTDSPHKSSVQAGSPLFLPELPTSKVVPAPDKDELESLMEPLYQRTWAVKRMIPNDGFNRIDEESPFLTRKIRFKGPLSARTFVTEIMRIENEEQHHISFSLWSGKRPIVTIFTQTHSAQVGDEIRTAITSRDIRLAVRLESFLDASQLVYKDGRVGDPL